VALACSAGASVADTPAKSNLQGKMPSGDRKESREKSNPLRLLGSGERGGFI